MTNRNFTEKKAFSMSAWPIIIIMLIFMGFSAIIFFLFYLNKETLMLLAPINFIVFVLTMRGVFVVNPNQAKIFMFFGHYAGTARKHGLQWTNTKFIKRTKKQTRTKM